MDKYQIAAVLDEIGTLLEIQGENSFRCNAYHNAARSLEQIEEALADLIAQDRLGEVRGVGGAMKVKITTLVNTGTLAYYEELKAKVPAGLLAMLRLPNLG